MAWRYFPKKNLTPAQKKKQTAKTNDIQYMFIGLPVPLHKTLKDIKDLTGKRMKDIIITGTTMYCEKLLEEIVRNAEEIKHERAQVSEPEEK